MGQHTHYLRWPAHSLQLFVLFLLAGSCSHIHLLPNKGLLLVGDYLCTVGSLVPEGAGLGGSTSGGRGKT